MINLAAKYEKQLVKPFYTKSILEGKTNQNYKWDGVASVFVYTIQTQTPNNYSRTGVNRYGTPSDVQDTVQELKLDVDIANSLVVDKGDNTEQMMIKNALGVIEQQEREQYIPYFIKHCFTTWASKAGTTATLALTKSNVAQAFVDARKAFTNDHVPMDGRYVYVNADTYSKLLLSPEFINLEKLGTKALENGVVGKIAGFMVVEASDDFFPADTAFIATHKNSVTAPIKFQDANVHQNPPGISGHQLDLRLRAGADVLTTLNKGVYVHKTA